MSKKVKGTKIRFKDSKYSNKSNINNEEALAMKTKRSKIRKKSDKQLEKEALMEENISIFVVCLIVILCFIVGIVLGIYLYDMALSNGNVVTYGLLELFF